METPSRQGLSPRAPSSARAPSSGGDALFRQRLTPDIDEVIRQRKSELQKLKERNKVLKQSISTRKPTGGTPPAELPAPDRLLLSPMMRAEGSIAPDSASAGTPARHRAQVLAAATASWMASHARPHSEGAALGSGEKENATVSPYRRVMLQLETERERVAGVERQLEAERERSGALEREMSALAEQTRAQRHELEELRRRALHAADEKRETARLGRDLDSLEHEKKELAKELRLAQAEAQRKEDFERENRTLTARNAELGQKITEVRARASARRAVRAARVSHRSLRARARAARRKKMRARIGNAPSHADQPSVTARLEALTRENRELKAQLSLEVEKASNAAREAETRFKDLEYQVRLRYEAEGSTLREDVRALREMHEQSARASNTPPETKFIVCFSLWVLMLTLGWAFSRDDGLEHQRFTY